MRFPVGGYSGSPRSLNAHRRPYGAALTFGRIGSDYQPKPAAVGSVFWPCGVIQPVPGLFVGPTGNSVALGDSNTLARA